MPADTADAKSFMNDISLLALQTIDDSDTTAQFVNEQCNENSFHEQVKLCIFILE